MPNPQPSVPAPPAEVAAPFLGQLAEVFSDGSGARAFAPLRAGAYLLALQASARHRWCEPRAAVPPAEVVAWEVLITDAQDRAVGPETHPWLFRRRPWVFHWLNAAPGEEVPVGRLVPTWLVQQLIDFLQRSAPLPPR